MVTMDVFGQYWSNFQDLIASLNISESELRFVASFFGSLVVNYASRFVPSVKGRHLYAVVTGFLLIYYPFGYGCFNVFIPAILTYIAMRSMRDHCGTLAWMLDFSYLIGCHILNASGSAWKEGKMDFTGAQMVITLKLIAGAMCYQDGLKPDEALKNDFQRDKKLTKLPSMLEWLSYLFASGNLLAGPHFEMSDYLMFIERRGPWDPKAPRKVPNPIIPGFIRLGKALFCMAFFLTLSRTFNVETAMSPWYYSLSLPLRIAVIYAIGAIAHFKYYFAWSVSESAMIFSGFCFNGWDSRGRARWDRYFNTSIRGVELQTSAAQLATYWNTCTGSFLRYYVYERLAPKGKKPTFGAMLITQMVSGLWHGIFPGYAMFFINSAFMFESSKMIFRHEKNWPRWVQKFPLWVLFKWALTAFLLEYSAMPFLALHFNEGWAIWRSVYFIGHGLIFAIFLLNGVFPPRSPKKRQAEATVTLNGETKIGNNVKEE